MMVTVVLQIKTYLPSIERTTIKEIQDLFDIRYSLETIIKALNYIIQRPGIVKDRYGMSLFLKEQKNGYQLCFFSLHGADSNFFCTIIR